MQTQKNIENFSSRPGETREATETLRPRQDVLSVQLAKDDVESLSALQHIAKNPAAARQIAEANPLHATYLYLKSVQRIDELLNPPSPSSMTARFVSIFISKKDIPTAAEMAKTAVALRDALKGLRSENDRTGSDALTNTLYGEPDPQHPRHAFGPAENAAQESLTKNLNMPTATVRQLRYAALAMTRAQEPDIKDYLQHKLLPLKLGHNTYEPYKLNDPALQETADLRNVLSGTLKSWRTNVLGNAQLQRAMGSESEQLGDLSQSLPIAIQNIDGRDSRTHTNLRALYKKDEK